jgi:hypothetical protein
MSYEMEAGVNCSGVAVEQRKITVARRRMLLLRTEKTGLGSCLDPRDFRAPRFPGHESKSRRVSTDRMATSLTLGSQAGSPGTVLSCYSNHRLPSQWQVILDDVVDEG